MPTSRPDGTSIEVEKSEVVLAMGTEIVKIDRDRDLYLEWDSRVESPTFLGTRAETAAYLAEPKRVPGGTMTSDADVIEERLARADAEGSSGYRPTGCTWEVDGLIYQQAGHLPRGKLGELADRWLAAAGDELPDITDMLEPFDD